MSSTVEWVAGRAWFDAVAVVYRQQAGSWLAGLYLESIENFSLLFEPVSSDPEVISSLIFANEIDDPSGPGTDAPPEHVRGAFQHVDGVIHWRVQRY